MGEATKREVIGGVREKKRRQLNSRERKEGAGEKETQHVPQFHLQPITAGSNVHDTSIYLPVRVLTKICMVACVI